ncbi:hypothetical protein CBE89_02645 [Corynebacterium striatum]|uniref:Porin n=1 Tax=Corynebacterium striatum TaxID=43770 RepID=A0A2Z2J5R8_CORST|nr:hypothetical protein [Corynebacterium striatum]ART20518.1 hypothetical protein CBE89_02645 [Corynebacterium striatum]QQU78975.1 hypothetical protein I6I73_09385 [Corynebacterium striatum]
MDLSLIQTHLDNFVDTWKGWNNVFTGLNGFLNLFLGGDAAPINGISSTWDAFKDLQSSK